MSQRALLGIVTYNRANLLARVLDSALSQRACSVRVAVIDNASTDDTGKFSSMFPQVDWMRWDQNRGHMTARNYWMLNAEEEYFVSLDDDAWFLHGDEISVAVDFLDSNPMVGAIAFDILSPDRSTPVSRAKPRQTGLFIGCGHVVRTKAVRAVGGYDNFPGLYGAEEKDLCLRLLDIGFQTVFLPGVHVWHEKSPLSRIVPDQHRSGVCNDMVMTLRRTPGAMLPFAIGAKIFRHLRFAASRELLAPCLQGLYLFARSAPATFRTRRPVRIHTLSTFVKLTAV